MRAFSFRLEPILTLRTWEEERARTAYGQALQQERRFIEALRAAEKRIDSEVTAWRQASEKTIAPDEREHRWRHLLALERERHDIAQKLISARRLREQKMKLLVDAHRRVRILTTLRTQRHQAHMADQRRREEKELDEIVTARFQPDI